MGLYLIVLVLLLVLAGGAWLAYGRRPGSGRRRIAAAKQAATPPRPGGIDKLKDNKQFWGVELAQTGCMAARDLQGRKFTFDEAPALPLAGCDSAACTCQFRGMPERRMRIRRTHPDRREVVRFNVNKPDRRSRISRRRADKWVDHTY
ncbi:MAG: hypothetical protein R3F42_03750 [Pseudomonadota bacterium]